MVLYVYSKILYCRLHFNFILMAQFHISKSSFLVFKFALLHKLRVMLWRQLTRDQAVADLDRVLTIRAESSIGLNE